MTTHEVIHPSRPRVYVRRFSHEEAALRYWKGESLNALAREYGVSRDAVKQAIRRLDPAVREAENQHKRALRTTVCEVCGGPAMKLVGGKLEHNPDGRILCSACRAKARREGVEVDAEGRVLRVRCFTCQVWKEPDVFSRGVRYRDLRDGGFHNECRQCGSARRTAYRDKNRVPCEGCGKPVEGKGRANSKSRTFGRVLTDPNRPFLCLTCWHASREGRAAARAGVEASVLARRKT